MSQGVELGPFDEKLMAAVQKAENAGVMVSERPVQMYEVIHDPRYTPYQREEMERLERELSADDFRVVAKIADLHARITRWHWLKLKPVKEEQ